MEFRALTIMSSLCILNINRPVRLYCYSKTAVKHGLVNKSQKKTKTSSSLITSSNQTNQMKLWKTLSQN